MSDKPISQMTSKEMRKFLIDSFGSVRKATNQLKTFESKIQTLKTKAEEAISAEMLAISRNINAEKGSINSKAQITRELAITNQGLISEELKNTKKLAQDTKVLVDERLNKANDLLSKIEEYHGILLTDTTDENGDDVLSIKTEMANYIKDQQEQFATLRTDLKKEIRDLLPEAGAASLSGAYFEAKKRYGSVPDKKNDGEFWFYVLFIAPLVVIIILMVFGGNLKLGVFIDNDGTLNPNAILNRFFISSPFAMMSWFGWGSIRLNRRLYEEYNHKQRVMELYHSFNREFKGDRGKEQKQKLLDIMLENVADKPSLAVHSGKKKIKKISLLWGMFVLTKGSENLSNADSDTDENDSDADDTKHDTDENDSDTDDTNNDTDENNSDADDANNNTDKLTLS